MDVSVNVTGPSQGMAGQPFTYTVTVGNNSLEAADGTTFINAVPAQAVGVTATCTASDGAGCPASLAVSDTTVSGTVPSLPHLGRVDVVIRGSFAKVSPSSVTDSAHVDPPTGVADSDPSSNDSSVSTTVMAWVSDLAVSISQSADTFDASGTDLYTATITNGGPTAADGAAVDLVFDLTNSGSYSDVAYTVESCTATGGAECPSTTPGSGSWSARLGAFPAGASLTATLRATLTPAAGACRVQTGRLQTTVTSRLPADVTDPVAGNNRAELTTTTPAPPACRLADLRIEQTTATTSVTPGTPIVYTVVVTNDGPGDTSGLLRFDNYTYGFTGGYVYGRLHLEVTSCSGDGVPCPDGLLGATSDTGQLTSSFDSFAPGATLTVVYELTPYLSDPPGCSTTAGRLSNSVSALVGAGVTDPVQNNTAGSNLPAPSPRTCPTADLAVGITPSNGEISSGAPGTYTMTVTNRGPDSADGATLYQSSDFYFPYDGESGPNPSAYLRADLEVISCTGVGGVACPDFPRDGGGASLGTAQVGSFPPGATLTVVYKVTPRFTPGGLCGAVLYQSAYVAVPAGGVDPRGDNNNASAQSSTGCRDISVNQTVAPAQVRALQPFAVASTVRNGSTGPARSVQFSNVVPEGLTYVSSSCEAVDTGSVCGEVRYDPATRTVSSVIGILSGSDGAVRITVRGTSGPVPGTYRSTARAVSGTGPDAYDDPVATSDESTVTLQVSNTASRITVTKQVSGLPDGVPRPTTFTGQVTCGTQGAKPWRVTVPAGGTTAQSPTLTFYDGESCTVTEDTPPAAPSGYHYTGPTLIAPATIGRLGDSQKVEVTATSELALSGQLGLTSSVSSPLTGPGAAVSYVVTLTNTGPVAATGLTLSAALPLGLTDATATDDGVVVGGTVVWDGLDLAPGESLTRTISGTAGPLTLGDLSVRFGVTDPDGFDPVAVDAVCDDDPTRSCATTRVADVGALRLVHTVDPSTVDLGVVDPDDDAATRTADRAAVGDDRRVTFTLTVTNVGTRAADDVAVTDRLPAGLCSVVPADGGTASDAPDCGPTVVSWPATDVPVGGAVEHEVTADVVDPSAGAALTAAFTIDNPVGFTPVEVDEASTCGETDGPDDAACATVQVVARPAAPEEPSDPAEPVTAGGGSTVNHHHDGLASTGGPSSVLLGLAATTTVAGLASIGAGRRRRRSGYPIRVDARR